MRERWREADPQIRDFDQGALHIVERVNHLLGFDHLGQGR
jgi:hypothetical protein